MLGSIITSIVVVVFILVLSLITISKGYGYKHSVDPLPEETSDEKMEKQNSM